MFISRLFVSFIALGAVAVSASPAPVEKRAADVSSVLAVVSTLQDKTSAILPQIDSLVAGGTASKANVTPLLQELVGALNTASTSFSAIGPVHGSSAASNAEVANSIAPIISDITTSLNGANAVIPGFSGILLGLGLDFALAQVLFGLEFVLAGVLHLIATLLFTISGVLRGLAFGLLLGALGL